MLYCASHYIVNFKGKKEVRKSVVELSKPSVTCDTQFI